MTFSYGEYEQTTRAHIVREHNMTKRGIWLRKNSPYNTNIIDTIKVSGKKRFYHVIDRIEVDKYDPNDGMVWLMVWTKPFYNWDSYNVFWIKMKPNKEWSCEGDLGLGLVKYRSMEKLDYTEWIEKYFEKDADHNYYTSIYEKVEVGFAPSDMSRWRKKDLEEEYQAYLNGTNNFIVYDE